LFFLPGGKSQTGPADLFNTGRWAEVAAAIKDQFSFFVIDAPPAGVFADFDLIQAQVEGVVLVVREDHTNRMLWMRAMQNIPSDKMIGAIMNCVQPWFLGKSFGYYQYYYYSKYYTGQA
jgi:Mrp family chromosome partitioning ATPase